MNLQKPNLDLRSEMNPHVVTIVYVSTLLSVTIRTARKATAQLVDADSSDTQPIVSTVRIDKLYFPILSIYSVAVIYEIYSIQ